VSEFSLPDLAARARRLLAKRRRLLAGAVTIAGHLSILLALLTAHTEPPQDLDLRLMTVTMIEAPPPAEPVAAPTPVQPSPAKTPQRKNIFRKTPAPPDVVPQPAGEDPTPMAGVEVSDAQLAGAQSAGSGPSGGGCNMPRLLQNALRKDPMVQAAVAQAHRGEAIMVWNGDWIRRPGQEGNGLAAVREAMMWEIGFAPDACRAQPVHGLVLLTLNDGPGAARLVLGSGDWRWSDLLFSSSAAGGGSLSGR